MSDLAESEMNSVPANGEPDPSPSQPDPSPSQQCEVATLEDWAVRWEQGKSGWHRTNVHVLLEKHEEKLFQGKTGLKVLVPLCGKTLDLIWLAEKGHTVVGIEGVEQPILEFFTENNMEYTKEALTDISGYVYKSADGKISIYQCDIFDFNKSLCGTFDCVWDRGSFVAILKEEREKYVKVMKSLASASYRILLVTLQYDPALHPGPPHLTPEGQIQKLFGEEYQADLIETYDALEERWINKGMTYFNEVLYYVRAK